MTETALRIGNASGFYGDRFSAVREMLTGGPLDVLTGDYLAELTMLILGRDRMKDTNRGYAKTFLRQMEENLELAKENGVKIVANAGASTRPGWPTRCASWSTNSASTSRSRTSKATTWSPARTSWVSGNP